MRYQITGSWGWPIGDKVIPGGTILNFDDERDYWAVLAKKQGTLPPNCLCLDLDAWNAVKNYPSNVRPASGGFDV
jgi:hypothetical protein